MTQEHLSLLPLLLQLTVFFLSLGSEQWAEAPALKMQRTGRNLPTRVAATTIFHCLPIFSQLGSASVLDPLQTPIPHVNTSARLLTFVWEWWSSGSFNRHMIFEMHSWHSFILSLPAQNRKIWLHLNVSLTVASEKFRGGVRFKCQIIAVTGTSR